MRNQDAEQDAARNHPSEEPGLDSLDHEASEGTPLLPTDLPPEVMPSKSLRLLVTIIGGMCLVLIGISQGVVNPALQEIMEDVICRGVYSDHHLNAVATPDSRCKDDAVQKVLLMVRGWDTSCEMMIPLLVQIPFGIIADKYGRRIVIFLSLFGVLLKTLWTVAVLSFPDKISIWAILWGNLAYLLGGGGSLAGAMCYTLFSDVTPAAERTMVFYQLNAVFRIVNVVVTPLAAFLLSVEPWIAVWLGVGLLGLGTALTLLLPETLDLRKAADQRHPEDVQAEYAMPQTEISTKSAIQRALSTTKNDFAHIWRFLLGSRSVVVLMACNALVFPIKLLFINDLLAYMTKRYHWSWSTATYMLSIENFFGMGMLMVVLPALAWLLDRRGRSPLQRDLFLVRMSTIFIFLGSLLLAFAPVPWLCVIALMVYSFGGGFSPLFRSILSIIVEPHTIGALNTVIGTIESCMGLISAPALAWLLAKGMAIGGVWSGLSFMITTALAGVAVLGVFAFRLPPLFA